MENNTGYIYIINNPAMPGLIKIGVTYAKDVKTRIAQLYNTSVPFAFELVYAAKVANPEKVEAAIHTAFAPNRVNAKREFFDIDPIQAISIIKLLEIQDSTAEINNESEPSTIDKIELDAGKEYAKKRPRLDFLEMNIPIGSELVCNKNGETAIVKTNRYVLFRNEETSLTSATKLILENDYAVAPGPYWTFNGKSLHDIYNETYLRNE